jgi:hypothetical protein
MCAAMIITTPTSELESPSQPSRKLSRLKLAKLFVTSTLNCLSYGKLPFPSIFELRFQPSCSCLTRASATERSVRLPDSDEASALLVPQLAQLWKLDLDGVDEKVDTFVDNQLSLINNVFPDSCIPFTVNHALLSSMTLFGSADWKNLPTGWSEPILNDIVDAGQRSLRYWCADYCKKSLPGSQPIGSPT